MGQRMIEFENGTLQVKAEDLAHGLFLTPEEIMQGFRDGTITSLCEKGADADEGRHRLTFYTAKRRLRLIVDAQGVILKKSSSDYRREMFGLPLDRKPGAAPNDAVTASTGQLK